MKNIYKALCLVVLATVFVACPSDDTSRSVTPLRDYQEVYDEDILEIEDYLHNNFITVDSDLNATVEAIPDGGTQTSIWDQTTYPLQFFTVKNDGRVTNRTDGRVDDDVEYKVYYLIINEGGGSTPTSVDSTYVAYKGWNMENTIFDQNNNGLWFTFPDVGASSISGFRQILSKIKSEVSHSENPDGTITRVNYGNVVVFIPSALAYFNSARTQIPAYSPINFQIKLFNVKERDHEGDKVLSKYEDLNSDNDYFNDDTDGDFIPDFLDFDDDNDRVITKNEIKISDGVYYDYNSIPNCGSGTLKKHIDPSCQ
jgi:hypothetical protein